MPLFDTCIITASNDQQAATFRRLLARRLERGLYPREIEFRVYADPPGGRAGSGGGTLWALLQYLDEIGHADSLPPRHKTLLIHAGGESRRLPCYVPEGKIFAPVPAPSSSILPPVVLDLELTLYLKYPWRDGELIVSSGDVIIDFNTDLLDMPAAPLCGFAARDSYERGSRHGVFAFDPISGAVRDYFQKAPPEELARHARIEGTQDCAVDLGIVSFRRQALEALLDFGRCRFLEGPAIRMLQEGRLYMDLYLELLTACLSGLDFDSYLARMGAGSKLSREILEALYTRFHPCGLAGVLVKQPAFVHFGGLLEYPAACRQMRSRELLPLYNLHNEELVPEVSDQLIRFNSLNAQVQSHSGDVYVEACRNIQVNCEGSNLLIGLDGLELDGPIPRGICLDQRRIDAETVCCIYHCEDTWKTQSSMSRIRFCGVPLLDWLAARGLSAGDVFPEGRQATVDLNLARLFVPGADAAFLQGYWKLPPDPLAWGALFRQSRRLSIAEVNAGTNAAQRDTERAQARKDELIRILHRSGFSSVPEIDFLDLQAAGLDLAPLESRYVATDDPLLRAYRGRLLHAAGLMSVPAADRIEVSFAQRGLDRPLRIAVKIDQIVWARSPLRLDLAGGWTDTPPYTNRYGGSVVNVAVDLNGQSPIQVFVRRTTEPTLRIHSIDLGVTESIADTRSLCAYNDPQNPFALPRAALVLLGVGKGLAERASLEPVFQAAGGGLELTLLCAVPKGSGLGTSSILAGTILAALERFFGREGTREELFLKVLEVEQMLTTGGGWQDQIGGLVGGVKYIESRPALKPHPIIHQLDPWIFEDPRSTERVTLFYTGVTRLAKGLLQEVVAGVNGMGRAYLFTHRRIGELAREAREAISLRDADRLGRLIAEAFTQNKHIHGSTTNENIEAMVAASAPHVTGMKLLGAGGGGFALFLSPDAAAAASLRTLLAGSFEDDRARLVDWQLNKKGLEVTVS